MTFGAWMSPKSIDPSMKNTTNAPKTFWRSLRIDISRSDMRSVAYSAKMKSIGPIEVKNALLNSSTQKSVGSRARAPASTTKSASDVRNGLQTVEKIRAMSDHTRGRTPSGSGAGAGWWGARTAGLIVGIGFTVLYGMVWGARPSNEIE